MSTNPNVLILNKAWGMLWDSTSAYYLPAILQNGGVFGSTTIPPMTSVAVPDQNHISLYASSTWGYVDISLTSISLAGLPSIENQTFTPTSDASSVTAVVAFGQLTIGGSYEVDGSSVAGSAMDVAESNADPTPPIPERRRRTAAADPNLDLARQYRAQLAQTTSGMQMVSTYYDHNDAMTFILDNSNAFSQAWPNAAPTGKKTAYYMSVTSDGAANPTQQAGIGDADYNLHAYYMQTTMTATALSYANGSTDPENPFYALALDTVKFKNATIPVSGQGSTAVQNVMNDVQNAAPPQALAGQIEEPELVRAAREMAERDYPMWEQRSRAEHATRAALVTAYKSTGTFSFSFPMPTLTLTASVTVSGSPPNETLTVTFTTLTATIPNVVINLLTGSDPSFTADAQSEINDADWFQRVIGTQVNAQLGSPGVLTYLSNVFNQAIANAL